MEAMSLENKQSAPMRKSLAKAQMKRCRFASKDKPLSEPTEQEDPDWDGTDIATNKAEYYLSLAISGKHLPPSANIQSCIPHLPRAGTKYLVGRERFTLNDGYTWKEITRKSSLLGTRPGKVVHYTLYYISMPNVSPKFTRETYELDDKIFVAYEGDEAFGKPSKPEESFYQQYDQYVTEDRHRNHEIPNSFVLSTLPRPVSRVSSRASGHHRELPTDQLYHTLSSVAEELANGKVVKNLTIFPSLQMTLVHPDMTKEFENCCKMLESAHGSTDEHSYNGIKLFYDTTFSFGRIYATVLTYVNGCYEGNPVMPLAVNLHERKFKSSHQLFWARIVGDLPALQKYRFPLIIDDAEPAVHLAVRTQAPNLVQLEAWTHRFRDIDTYLQSKGYGEEAIKYYKACISYLLHSESKQAMHDRFRKEFETVWPKDFVFYYRQKLLPRSGRLGQWAMLKMKIKDELFLCAHTNPQEEFHILCQHFSGWDRLNVEQVVRAFYFLFLFYVSESSDNKSVDGIFKLKRQYCSRTASHKSPLRPSYKFIPHPSQICSFIQRNFNSKASSTAPGSSATSQWLAYGATEVFAEVASDRQQKMEDVCDIRCRLEDFIMHHPSSFDEAESFSNLNLSGDESRHYLSNGLTVPHSSALGAPPSPAPNGRVPSPAPPIRQEDLQASLPTTTVAAAVGYNHPIPNLTGLTPIPEVPSIDNRRASATSQDTFEEDSVFHRATVSQLPPPRKKTPPKQPVVSKQSETALAMAEKEKQRSEDTGSPLPSSMMLWKKVQHCVVFGGSFISASKEAAQRSAAARESLQQAQEQHQQQ